LNFFRQDDTIHSQDVQDQYTEQVPDDTLHGFYPEQPGELLLQHSTFLTLPPKTETVDRVQDDRLELNKLSGWNSNKNFFIDNGLAGIVEEGFLKEIKGPALATSGTIKPENIHLHNRVLTNIDWFLGIFLIITFLFIWIRIFYSKFFAILGNALISFQISATMFREKNALLHRVSLVLDFIYMMVISVFLFELSEYFRISIPGTSRFNLFLMFLNIIIIYSLFRNIILRLTGFLFLVESLLSEYLHNIFVINKGMGIALFPVVIMAHYLPVGLAPLVLVLGILLFLSALILKSIRAYQIIMHKDVFILYLILYLCTLEILPLLLGYKVFISLI
jgi:hypothetical protein